MSHELNIQRFVNTENICKQVFQTKLPDRNGLLLHIHNTNETPRTQQKLSVRFTKVSFDTSENLLVASNHVGNIVLIDLDRSKFWVLPPIRTCSVLKFSSYNSSEILLGMQNGAIYIINIETGEVTGELICHIYPVVDITFSQSHICLSGSKREAIVWDLRNNSKIQVLTLLDNCFLKFVMFIPVIGDILACFDDDSILIWKYGTYEVCKEIDSSLWHYNEIKSIAFTRNGRAAVFTGHLPHLYIFMVDTWCIINKIVLPDYITSIKKIAFIPQVFDGGSNKMLTILTGNGVLYFYDLELNVVINGISNEAEILKFDCSMNGKYISCLLKTGEINVYVGAQYTEVDHKSSKPKKAKTKNGKAVVNLKKSKELETVQKQINDYLDVNKLHGILKHFGEYPETYRSKIWTQLLHVPNNKVLYNNYINQVTTTSFDHLSMENKSLLKILKKLLSNLITWCPYFEHIVYLPVFVFPFVKIFQYDPICCFEVVCTIIINWCQHWFEYFPLPPINILAIIENVLLEHDPNLLMHLTQYEVTSKVYAWPLLESAFSEVLLINHWYMLWDHILSNEISFFIMCVIAYNITNRKSLLALKKDADFEQFYHNQNIINIKQLIAKCYALLETTSKRNHPNRYLEPFKSLKRGSYPTFTGFPKALTDMNFGTVGKLKNEQAQIQQEQDFLFAQKQLLTKNMELVERKKVEEERLKEMEIACRKKIIEEAEQVREQRSRINEMRKHLQLEEINIINKSRERILDRNTKQKEYQLQQLLDHVQQNRVAEEIEIVKTEGDLVKRYSELLHQKIKLEQSLQGEHPSPGLSNEYRLLKVQQQKLIEALHSARNSEESQNHLKNVALASSISAMDELILKIEMELAQQMADKYENVNKAHSAFKRKTLESETKQLEQEVSQLLSVLADVKSQETKSRLCELLDNAQSIKGLQKSYGNQYVHLQKQGDVSETISYVNSLGEDFTRLRKMIKEACDSSTDDEEERVINAVNLDAN
ncbi:hypothetical protein FQA39_LY03371 [Lamprigera yunnana]|nr:hypothetical protein FQA39_LY03371 [Lamprigera yunnana]